LTGLQSITIVAALPFVVVMIGLAVSLVKDLRSDPLMVRRRYAEEAVEQAVITGVTEHGDDFVLTVDRDPDAPTTT
jgi:choline-glycine betaine transporter